MISEETLDAALAEIKEVMLYRGSEPPELEDDQYQVLLVITAGQLGTMISEEVFNSPGDTYGKELDKILSELRKILIESGIVEGYPMQPL